jgi:glycosyltransferase involved in cell wall biosynthesis
MISFVIPAHNEEACLAATLDALLRAARQVGLPYEVIVVNDASTDRTGAIARERGVRVVDVQHRLIAATRNSGARAAHGEVLFFVDADTEASAEAVRAGLDALQQGAVGGGCVFRYNGPVPWWAHIVLPIGTRLSRRLKLIGGCFLFCPRSEFEAVGGFREQYYAAEDVVFVRALKSRGRFVIPRVAVLTSNRKVRDITLWRALRELCRFVVGGPEAYRSREGLDLWYGREARDPPAGGGGANGSQPIPPETNGTSAAAGSRR